MSKVGMGIFIGIGALIGGAVGFWVKNEVVTDYKV
jgi:hypothetical protein